DFVSDGAGGGTYTNTWLASDPCGNTTNVVFTQVISVVAVSIDASASNTSVQQGNPVILTATVTPNQPGVAVTFYISKYVNNIETPVCEVEAVTDANGIATTSKSGLPMDVYKIRAVAGDGCSESIAFVSVFDPNDNFVTGGGWITSLPG